MAKQEKRSSGKSPGSPKKKSITGDYFTFISSPFDEDDSRVIRVGRVEIPKNTEVERDTKDFQVIEWIRTGSGELIVGDSATEVQSGSVFYFGPQTPYKVLSGSNGSMVKYFVVFEGRQAMSILSQSGLSRTGQFSNATSENIEHTFKQLLTLGELNMHTKRMSEILFESLVLQISETATSKSEEFDQSFETYRRCLHIIETQFINIHSLADAATTCGVAPAYMCRLFKQYENVSPYRLLIKKKMERAAWFLTNTNKMIKQIGAELGFNNPYHFSKLFKEHYGVAPTSFAEQRRV